MARQESRQAAELKTSRAELMEQLGRLDFRSERPGAREDCPARCTHHPAAGSGTHAGDEMAIAFLTEIAAWRASA
jgi:hypothetical protein